MRRLSPTIGLKTSWGSSMVSILKKKEREKMKIKKSLGENLS